MNVVDRNEPVIQHIAPFQRPAAGYGCFLSNDGLLRRGILSKEAVAGIKCRCQEMDDKDDENLLKF